MRIFQAVCAVAFALLFLSGECQGQAVLEKSAAVADFSQEPFVLERSVVKVRWDADGKGERESCSRGKIQSESAVRQIWPTRLSLHGEFRIAGPSGSEGAQTGRQRG